LKDLKCIPCKPGSKCTNP